MDKTFNLFVYGTLTDSNTNGRLLKGFKHEKASSKGKIYVLKTGYPGAVFSEGSNGSVSGQLITGIPYVGTSESGKRFSIIAELDHYEGCDKKEPLYTRKSIRVRTEGGEEIDAEVYEMNDILKDMVLSEIEGGDWNEFLSGPCESLDEIEEVDCFGEKHTVHLCKLTGKSCPYISYERSGLRKTGLCTLPAYAKGHPEDKVPEDTLAAIAGMFNGCMKCGALTKHYYLEDCCLRGFPCYYANDQLKLMYLAKCYGDRHSNKLENENI